MLPQLMANQLGVEGDASALYDAIPSSGKWAHEIKTRVALALIGLQKVGVDISEVVPDAAFMTPPVQRSVKEHVLHWVKWGFAQGCAQMISDEVVADGVKALALMESKDWEFFTMMISGFYGLEEERFNAFCKFLNNIR